MTGQMTTEIEVGWLQKLQDTTLRLKGLATVAKVYRWSVVDGYVNLTDEEKDAAELFLTECQSAIAGEIAGLSDEPYAK